ncbi:hypothetical protein D3C87_1731010 [compost metagenome]
MSTDRRNGLRRIAGEDAVEDRLVLGDGVVEAAWRDDEAAGAIKIGAGLVDDSLDLGQPHGAEDDVVEVDVDLGESLGIIARSGVALGGHVGVQGFDDLGIMLADEDAQGFAL